MKRSTQRCHYWLIIRAPSAADRKLSALRCEHTWKQSWEPLCRSELVKKQQHGWWTTHLNWYFLHISLDFSTWMYAIFTFLIHQSSGSFPPIFQSFGNYRSSCWWDFVCMLKSCNSQQNPPKAGQPDVNNENIVFLYLFAGSLPGQWESHLAIHEHFTAGP